MSTRVVISSPITVRFDSALPHRLCIYLPFYQYQLQCQQHIQHAGFVDISYLIPFMDFSFHCLYHCWIFFPCQEKLHSLYSANYHYKVFITKQLGHYWNGTKLIFIMTLSRKIRTEWLNKYASCTSVWLLKTADVCRLFSSQLLGVSFQVSWELNQTRRPIMWESASTHTHNPTTTTSTNKVPCDGADLRKPINGIRIDPLTS